MTTYVFLGPTLTHDEARRVLDAHYLPPAAVGDVVRVLERHPRPTTIAIIDGLFEHTPAVWHKEILYALDRGVRVLGASSMGALRAAELHVFGMEGVGAVFASFRDGVLEDDDEVAVAHLPAGDGFRPVSDAMVNLREGIRQAAGGGAVSAPTADALERLAKEMFYPERSWSSLLAAGAAAGLPPDELAALKRHVAAHRPDLQRADALLLLQRLAGPPVTPPRPPFDFVPTFHWKLMRATELAGEGVRALADDAGGSTSASDVLGYLRVRHAADPSVRREALLSWLLAEEAGRDPSLLEGAAVAPDPIAQLRAALDLTADRLLERHRPAVDSHLPLALDRAGLRAQALADLRARQALAHRGLDRPSLSDTALTADELLHWYAQRLGRAPATADEHATTLGFESGQQFLEELARLYLLEH